MSEVNRAAIVDELKSEMRWLPRDDDVFGDRIYPRLDKPLSATLSNSERSLLTSECTVNNIFLIFTGISSQYCNYSSKLHVSLTQDYLQPPQCRLFSLVLIF